MIFYLKLLDIREFIENYIILSALYL